jgi:hypothetical protein
MAPELLNLQFWAGGLNNGCMPFGSAVSSNAAGSEESLMVPTVLVSCLF